MVWDDKLVRGSTNHRKTMEDVEYKSTRDHEKNAKVYDLYRNIRKLCKHAGFHNMHPGVLEGDDVMAFLSKKLPGHNVVVSVDQDLLQLINENVDVYDPMKKRLLTIHNFDQFFPVSLDKFIKYKAAMGDKSDNIPGIPKVGTKRAAMMARENFKNITTEQQEILERNIKVIDLNYSLQTYPNEVKLYEMQLNMQQSEDLDVDAFIAECKSIECYDVTEEFVRSLQQQTPAKLADILT
jgi:5'-3' exonuclease